MGQIVQQAARPGGKTLAGKTAVMAAAGNGTEIAQYLTFLLSVDIQKVFSVDEIASLATMTERGAEAGAAE